jgi:hypothetical protein
MAISGIKSVDFLITAIGEGVVNHNGSFSVYNPAAGKTVDNHMFPKLRGLDPMQRIAKGEDGRTQAFSLTDPEIANAKLIVSAECVRSQIFKDVSFGLRQVTVENVAEVLASLHGLVRGYLITAGGRNFARKSCLYVTDFECAKPDLAFNQGTNSKARGTELEETSIYSYFKTGKDLHYTGKASLSIEDLQFIPMENSLGRSAYDHQVTVETGQTVAAKITQFLGDLAPAGVVPQARFIKKAVRLGAVSKVGDAGILLNDDAIRVVVGQVRELLDTLCIRQGKGYLQVTDVRVDFNNGGRVFRSESDPVVADAQGVGPFAAYYAEESMTDTEFAAAQKALRSASDDKKAAKDAAKAAKAESKVAAKAAADAVTSPA